MRPCYKTKRLIQREHITSRGMESRGGSKKCFLVTNSRRAPSEATKGQKWNAGKVCGCPGPQKTGASCGQSSLASTTQQSSYHFTSLLPQNRDTWSPGVGVVQEEPRNLGEGNGWGALHEQQEPPFLTQMLTTIGKSDSNNLWKD